MTIVIVDEKPAKSVVRQCVCKNCGVTLEYVPADIRDHRSSDYTGGVDIDPVIDCPKCTKMIFVRHQR